MREVRMTFGEHLDELRYRIIISLFFLIVTVIACLSFGEQLMFLTLGPHHEAIQAAQTIRRVRRMQSRLGALDAMARGEAPPPPGSGLTKDDLRWEVLFKHEVAVGPIRERLQAAFDRAVAGETSLESFSEEQRRELRAVVKKLGQGVSQELVEVFAPDQALGRSENLFERLLVLEEDIAEADRLHGPTATQAALGLGESFEDVRSYLTSFQAALEGHRDRVAAQPLGLLELQELVRRSRLPEYLDREIADIERDARAIVDPPSSSLMVIHYLENFLAYLKVSLIFGLVFAFPFILWQVWKFVGAGLHETEQKYVQIFLPFSLVLFVCGVLFGYFYMIPFGLQFLAGWGLDEVALNITLGNYLGLFITLTLLLGLVFQIPLAMVFLAVLDLVRVDTMRRMRKPAIFILVVLSAIITPPDPMTLLMMAGPLVLLYEVGIIVSWMITVGRKRRQAAAATGSETPPSQGSSPGPSSADEDKR